MLRRVAALALRPRAGQLPSITGPVSPLLRSCRLQVARALTTASPSRPPRVAIVGGGPSGFYVAHFLLKAHPEARVDIFEKYPVPYGLVRYGVAPDHPEVKNCINQFEATAALPNVRLFGNVHVGNDLSLADVRARYDAVVLSYGAAGDRPLNIPGEDLQGVMSAREFVAWYNGDPAAAATDIDLRGPQAVVFGMGNVALDVARILLYNPAELASTDISTRALSKLADQNGIQAVRIVGRRGPLEVTCTVKELRELKKLVPTDMDFFDYTTEEKAWIDANRPRRRTLMLLQELAGKGRLAEHTDAAAAATPRAWGFDFNLAPEEFLPDPDDPTRVGQVVLRRTRLEGPPGARKAILTDERILMPCQLAVRSIGFLGSNLTPELAAAFDEQRGHYLHENGRIKDQPHLYCSGWIKNGPIGTIAITMADAQDTAQSIAQDLELQLTNLDPSDDCADVAELLRRRKKTVVDYAGWQRIRDTELSTVRSMPAHSRRV